MMPGGDTLHRRSIRLPGYDYGKAGAYFVTMVTAGRQCLFGQIVDGEMQLGALGQIARQQWLRLLARFVCLELGTFVVMPNHVHGILIIHDHRGGTAGELVENDVEIPRRARTERFGKPVPHSIPTIIRSYKSAVAYRIHLVRGAAETVVWQRNYYEHIIRDPREWERIHLYIDSNPVRWSQDKVHPSIRL
ncbi:MAG TPA: transposase [Anaerolineales bacterium]